MESYEKIEKLYHEIIKSKNFDPKTLFDDFHEVMDIDFLQVMGEMHENSYKAIEIGIRNKMLLLYNQISNKTFIEYVKQNYPKIDHKSLEDNMNNGETFIKNNYHSKIMFNIKGEFIAKSIDTLVSNINPALLVMGKEPVNHLEREKMKKFFAYYVCATHLDQLCQDNQGYLDFKKKALNVYTSIKSQSAKEYIQMNTSEEFLK